MPFVGASGTNRLRIAQVAPLWTSVPPKTYGGIELVIHLLTEELVRRGHDVTLFASSDSRTRAKHEVVCEKNLIDRMAAGEAYDYMPYAVASCVEALTASDRFDVVHSHLGCATLPMGTLASVPVLHTVHSAVTVDDLWVLARYPQAPVTFCTERQAAPVIAAGRKHLHIVHNACDFNSFMVEETPGEYLAFLGRMGPHKNPVGAIEIARALGMKIVLAGEPMTGAESRYFGECVAPLIDGQHVVHLGAVSHEQKNALLKKASALLFPIQWDEPFGIVMIEAMACGTPVVAYGRGSVPEVVDPGITGYFGHTSSDLQDLVRQALQLDRGKVRSHAEARFSVAKMTDNFERIYLQLCTRETRQRAFLKSPS
jgi:glycosyltransferase involved in cell wall biosynthesis